MTNFEVIQPDTDGLLNRVFAVTRSITNASVRPNFGLIIPSEPDDDEMLEFVSPRLGGRFVAVNVETGTATTHARLTEDRLPVLSSMYTSNGLLLLDVPHGARPVTSYANSMRTDPEGYFNIFKDIGSICSQLVEKGYGEPDPTEKRHPILRKFAIAPDEYSESGTRTYLIPPYHFKQSDRTAFLRSLKSELTDTQVIEDEQAAYLVTGVEDGWE